MSILFCVFAVSLFLVVGRLGVWGLCLCSAWRIGLSDLCLYYDVCVCFFYRVCAWCRFVSCIGQFGAFLGYFSCLCLF